MLDYVIAVYLVVGVILAIIIPNQLDEKGLLVKHILLMIIFLPFTLVALIVALAMHIYLISIERVDNSKLGKMLNRRIK